MAGNGRPYRRIATEEAWISAELLVLYQKMLKDGSAHDPGFDSGGITGSERASAASPCANACWTSATGASPTWTPPESTCSFFY
jgi:hypothetical protein